MLGTTTHCGKRSTGLSASWRSCRPPGGGSSWPPIRSAAGSSARCTTACSNTWSRSRSRSACSSADADPAAVKALLDDVQQALDEAAQLAQRIYPPLLEAGGLAAALRAAATSAASAIRLDVPAGGSYPPEVAGAIYWCCLAALERAGAHATVTVRDEDGAVAFEVAADGSASRTGSTRSATASRRWRKAGDPSPGAVIRLAPAPGVTVASRSPRGRG